MSNCRRATGIFRRPPGEAPQVDAGGTGSNSRDDDRMVPRQLVPTDAWRKPMMAGVSGFWSSPVSTTWMRLPGLEPPRIHHQRNAVTDNSPIGTASKVRQGNTGAPGRLAASSTARRLARR